MKYLRWSVSALVLLVGCDPPPEPDYLVDNMTERSVCSTSNLIVKRRLESTYGGDYRSAHLDCSARVIDVGRVEISGAYEPPGAKNNPLVSARRYIARGAVNGSSLRLEEIKVVGVDDEFRPMSQFP